MQFYQLLVKYNDLRQKFSTTFNLIMQIIRLHQQNTYKQLDLIIFPLINLLIKSILFLLINI